VLINRQETPPMVAAAGQSHVPDRIDAALEAVEPTRSEREWIASLVIPMANS
jgi:hypothetical protein